MLDAWGTDPRTPLRFSLWSKKWKYRGEGNANLVIALPQELKIVRLHKHESSGISETNEEEERERVLREAIFCRGVMVPLLGDMYIQPPLAATLDHVEVRLLDQTLRAQRPVYRHHKGLHFSHVTIYPDYALLPLHLAVATTSTFCVEVKPKQGWIPGPDRRLPECTFCLNQYLKLKNGSVRSKSGYCPLDLFSGNQTRMKLALRMLLASPQNNLKIFEDGVLVYGDEVGGDLDEVLHQWLGKPHQILDHHGLVEKFCDLVYEALTRNLFSDRPVRQTVWDGLKEPDLSSIHTHCHQVMTPAFERVPSALVASVGSLLLERACDWSAEPLPQDCILARILRIQKLDQSGADCIYHTYHSGDYRPGVSDYSYVASMLKAGSNITPLHRYLLATTAKDCSIMVAFQRLDIPTYRIGSQIPANHVVRDLDAQSYVFNIGVSDLDPKPMSCIEKHRKRDCEILSACLPVGASTITEQ